MPHAALFVVQELKKHEEAYYRLFQCRTRLCLWCKNQIQDMYNAGGCFNAARGFVCGASPSLTALVSLVSNGSFGKSPDV